MVASVLMQTGRFPGERGKGTGGLLSPETEEPGRHRDWLKAAGRMDAEPTKSIYPTKSEVC